MAAWTDAYKKWDAFEDSDEDETTINDELVVTPHAPRETPATAADVFLRGPILDAVQRSRVYGDGKAFVDMMTYRVTKGLVSLLLLALGAVATGWIWALTGAALLGWLGVVYLLIRQVPAIRVRDKR